MPSPSLQVTLDKAFRDIQILANHRASSLTLEPKFQHFVAEVIMLRLFSIVENSIRETALKLSCQAMYRNGVVPVLLITCRSLIDAEDKLINYNRSRSTRLKWTKVRFVNESVREVIPSTESFRIQVSNHGAFLNEMRIVRNHIAHRTSSTSSDYRSVIRQVFGAQLRIQPGAFLTSTKRISFAKIDNYLVASRILVNDITNG